MKIIAMIIIMIKLAGTISFLNWYMGYMSEFNDAIDEAKKGNIEAAVDLLEDMTTDLVNATMNELIDTATDDIIDTVSPDL